MPENLPKSFSINTGHRSAGTGGLYLSTPHPSGPETALIMQAPPHAGTPHYLHGLVVDAAAPSEQLVVESIEVAKSKDLHDRLRDYLDRNSLGPQDARPSWPSPQCLSLKNEQQDAIYWGLPLAPRMNSLSVTRGPVESRFQSTGILAIQLHLVHATWYEEARRDLEEALIEVSDEGFDPPVFSTIEHTKRLLKQLSEQYQQLPDVQPMRDQTMAIRFENRTQDSSIVFVIEGDGSGCFIARINGRSDRVRVSNMSSFFQLGGRHAMDQAGIRRK